MKIANVAAAAAWVLLLLPASGEKHGVRSSSSASSSKEDVGGDDRVLASLQAAAPFASTWSDGRDLQSTGETTDSNGRNKGACTPTFDSVVPQFPGSEMGIGPIDGNMMLMKTTPPGTDLPPSQVWYSLYSATAEPFYLCNKQYQAVFPGMAGYTFRAVTNGETVCQNNVTDYSVVLQVYDVLNNKVIQVQKEKKATYTMYGSKPAVVRIPDTDTRRYGSVLLPNGVYQVSAKMYVPNGTVVDETRFGTDIYVVSC